MGLSAAFLCKVLFAGLLAGEDLEDGLLVVARGLGGRQARHVAVGGHDGDELAGDEQVLVADLLVGVEGEVVLLVEDGYFSGLHHRRDETACEGVQEWSFEAYRH